MKQINTLINVVLAVAVIALFVMYFNLKKSIAPPAPVAQTEVDSTDLQDGNLDSLLSKRVLDFPIACVNLDTVSAHFTYGKLRAEKQEASIRYRQNQYEKQLKALDSERIKTMTQIQNGTTVFTSQSQVDAWQQDWQKRAEKATQDQAQYEQTVIEQQSKLLNELNTSLRDFLKKYKKELNYSYVLPAGTAGTVLYANDSLDISQEVIKALNKAYASKIKDGKIVK